MNPDNPKFGSRLTRRAAAKILQKHDAIRNKSTSVKPKSLDCLLEKEDDLLLYRSELDLSGKLEARQRLTLEDYNIHMGLGVSEETYRRFIICSVPGQKLHDRWEVQTQLLSEIDMRKGGQYASRLQVVQARVRRLNIRIDPSKEAAEEALILLTDREIPLGDLIKESLRSRGETNELLRMQVRWLEDQRKKAKKQTATPEVHIQREETTIQGIYESPAEDIVLPQINKIIPEKENEFVLAGWDLFWTSRHWSKNENHLVPIPTTSRMKALECMEETIRGEVMVKPSSVLNALEFHLRRDVIQRALATRLRYGPSERRDWIKVKRGRDRILILIPRHQQVIFFAGNRDNIYR